MACARCRVLSAECRILQYPIPYTLVALLGISVAIDILPQQRNLSESLLLQLLTLIDDRANIAGAFAAAANDCCSASLIEPAPQPETRRATASRALQTKTPRNIASLISFSAQR